MQQRSMQAPATALNSTRPILANLLLSACRRITCPEAHALAAISGLHAPWVIGRRVSIA